MFCLWEGQKGKTAEDMATFINTDESSPAKEEQITNTVMTIDPALAGPVPPLACTFE